MPDFACEGPGQPAAAVRRRQVQGSSRQGRRRQRRAGEGAALADFNLDGLVDLVVVNRQFRGAALAQPSARCGGHWIEVKLDQPAPNRDAIGSWIEIRCEGMPVMRREIAVGGGHAGGRGRLVARFGLSGVEAAEMRVIWLADGTGAAIGNAPVKADGFCTS